MAKAVLDTTVLVSAFLKPINGGVSFELLRFAAQGSFDLYLSNDILEETARVLLREGRMRKRYAYPDSAVVEFCQNIATLSTIADNLPEVSVVRDPEDDMIIASAIAADADYLVSRDKDLLVLGEYEGIKIVTPEEFSLVLRNDRRPVSSD
jgi:putative PIN family toxin of toxin-antitoxin system